MCREQKVATVLAAANWQAGELANWYLVAPDQPLAPPAGLCERLWLTGPALNGSPG